MQRSTRIAAPAALLAAALGFGADAAHAAAPGVTADVVRRTLVVSGTGAADTLALRVRPDARQLLEIDAGDDGSADLEIKRSRFSRIEVRTGDGDDVVRVDDAHVAFTRATPTAIEGGAGADRLLGGAGDERFAGNDGDDLVDGNGGDDVARLGAGDNRFAWDAGDGSDVVEGEDGLDELVFTGSNADERFDVSAHGERARLRRDVGCIRMDLDGIERIATRALGGGDRFTAGDLSATDVNDLDADLAGAPAGSTGDGYVDRVVSRGGDGSDFGDVLGSQDGAFVLGMPTFLHVAHADSDDELTLDGRGGDDRMNTSALPLRVTLDGGAGGDDLSGGSGVETLLGRSGDDFADGNGGDDTAVLGTGDDIARWDPGDGSDVIEGQAGHDVLLFLGSAADEAFDVSANGSRVRFLRDVGNIAMDLDGVEKTDTLAQGGADTITVGDLSGTDLERVETNLSGVPGLPTPDGAVDRLLVHGTNAADAIAATGSAGTVDVTGLPATVRATRAEGAFDQLIVAGGAGADTLDQSGLAPGTIGVAFSD